LDSGIYQDTDAKRQEEVSKTDPHLHVRYFKLDCWHGWPSNSLYWW
jgi:hypothetical protein